MKKILIAILLLSGLNSTFAISLTPTDYTTLTTYFTSENWKQAFKESSRLLKLAEGDSSDHHAVVLYMNIMSAAGMVTTGQMSYEQLKKQVSKFEGQKILSVSRPVTMKDGSFGQTKLYAAETSYEAFTSVTNAKKVNILSFEKFIIKDRINIYDFQQSDIHCGGTLDKIETNPSQSIAWVLRLTVKDAFVRKAN